jgi:hypothetical protein
MPTKDAKETKVERVGQTATAADFEDPSESLLEREPARFAKGADEGAGDPGEVTVLPKTPQEIAEQGTAISASGSLDAGGNVPLPEGRRGQPPLTRVWATDTDPNTNKRFGFDPLQQDVVTGDAGVTIRGA